MVLALVLLLAAPSELDQLIAQMGTNQHYAAYAKIVALRSPKAARKVEKAIAGWSPPAQGLGLLIVAQLPPRTSNPSLRRMLRSEDIHVRLGAAVFLYQRGEKEMLERITESLRAGASDEAKLAAMVARVRSLKNDAVYAAWQTHLTPERSEYNLMIWLRAMSDEGYTGARKEAMALVSRDKRPTVRAVASAYLVRAGDRLFEPFLVKTVRSGALSAPAWNRVTGILADAGRYPDSLCAAIVEQLPKEENEISIQLMIDVLVEARYQAAQEALGTLLTHEKADIAEKAMSALAALGAQPESASLHKMLAGPDARRRLAAAKVLRRMDDEAGFPVVLELAARHKSWEIRRDACAALGDYRKPEAVPVLLDKLEDAHALVRLRAVIALSVTWQTLFPFRRFNLWGTGYNVQKPSPEAVAKIRAWWEKHREAGW
ncbi:MAG: HEAT repeat domain-containing protein [Planctomycetota bacterium]